MRKVSPRQFLLRFLSAFSAMVVVAVGVSVVVQIVPSFRTYADRANELQEAAWLFLVLIAIYALFFTVGVYLAEGITGHTVKSIFSVGLIAATAQMIIVLGTVYIVSAYPASFAPFVLPAIIGLLFPTLGLSLIGDRTR